MVFIRRSLPSFYQDHCLIAVRTMKWMIELGDMGRSRIIKVASYRAQCLRITLEESPLCPPLELDGTLCLGWVLKHSYMQGKVAKCGDINDNVI